MNLAIPGFKFLKKEVANKTVIDVNFITCKGSDLVMSLYVFLNGVIVLKVVPHPCY